MTEAKMRVRLAAATLAAVPLTLAFATFADITGDLAAPWVFGLFLGAALLTAASGWWWGGLPSRLLATGAALSLAAAVVAWCAAAFGGSATSTAQEDLDSTPGTTGIGGATTQVTTSPSPESHSTTPSPSPSATAEVTVLAEGAQVIVGTATPFDDGHLRVSVSSVYSNRAVLGIFTDELTCRNLYPDVGRTMTLVRDDKTAYVVTLLATNPELEITIDVTRRVPNATESKGCPSAFD